MFSVFTDETSGFSIRIFLFAVFNQSAVGGLLVSQFLCRIRAAHGFGTECTPENSSCGYVWVCRPVLEILSHFQTKNVIFHTRFQTRPLTSIPVFRPELWAEIMLSLLRLERKQKHYSQPFRIRIFFFLSYSFGIEAINRFRHSVVPLKTISDSRPKWTKSIPVFRPKRRKKPYPMGRHIPKWLI